MMEVSCRVWNDVNMVPVWNNMVVRRRVWHDLMKMGRRVRHHVNVVSVRNNVIVSFRVRHILGP